MANIQLLNMDCMSYMAGLDDKAFDLAIVDPPYGLNIAKEKPRVSGRWNYKPKQWDNKIPDGSFFQELKRVSNNQIIWGGNYFDLGASRGFIIWDKKQPVENFADCEFAWTSFDRVAKIFRFSFMLNDDKIHITQKPIKLYKWILHNYAKQGDKILDTHLGSGSSAIAAHDMGFDFVGTEIDVDYFNAATKRYNNAILQTKLF